jgi:hypothetical protein
VTNRPVNSSSSVIVDAPDPGLTTMPKCAYHRRDPHDTRDEPNGTRNEVRAGNDLECGDGADRYPHKNAADWGQAPAPHGVITPPLRGTQPFVTSKIRRY